MEKHVLQIIMPTSPKTIEDTESALQINQTQYDWDQLCPGSLNTSTHTRHYQYRSPAKLFIKFQSLPKTDS